MNYYPRRDGGGAMSDEYTYFYHIRPISSTCYHIVIFCSKNQSAGLTWLEQEERVTEEDAKAWALRRISARNGAPEAAA
jgi:hypothetical protein